MKILITGIAGFVGSTLARTLLARDPSTEIVGIDDMSYGYTERLADLVDRIRFVQADIANLQAELGTERFDVIVHCAAIAPLPECQIDSRRALIQNVANCGSVADFATASGSRNIVFFSSGAVYEGVQTFPTPESIEPTPRLTYPASKYLAEKFFQAYCESYDINVTAIRLFNLYGPHQDYFRKQPPLIGYLIKALLHNEPVTLFSTGEQRRDYIYIDDLVNLVQRIYQVQMGRESGGHFDVVNAGSGEHYSVNDIVRTLERVAGRQLVISRLPATEYWDKYPTLFQRDIPLRRDIIAAEVNKFSHASVEVSRERYGWHTQTSLEQGLAACYDYASRTIAPKA